MIGKITGITSLIFITTLAVNAYAVDEKKYLDAAEKHAAMLLEYGRDDRDYYETSTWGRIENKVKTPLFVEQLAVNAPHRPNNYILTKRGTDAGYPTEVITSSAMQNLQLAVFFQELATLTGKTIYQNVGDDIFNYVLSPLEFNSSTGTVSNGFMDPASKMGHFGNHSVLDLVNDKIIGVNTSRGMNPSAPISSTNPSRPIAEAKGNFYQLKAMHKANPSATKDYIETFVNNAVRNWSTLDTSRHLNTHWPYNGGVWSKTDGINTNQSVPIPGTTEGGVFAEFPLAHLAMYYARLYDEERAWKLAYQILKRHDNNRHSSSGFYPQVYNNFSTYKWNTTIDNFPLTFGVPMWLKLADTLFDRPQDEAKRSFLIDFAIRDLKAFRNSKRFYPGQRGYALVGTIDDRNYGTRYEGGAPTIFYSFALAHKLAKTNTDKEFMWEALRDFFSSSGLGDIGTSNGTGIKMITQGAWKPFENWGDEWDFGHRNNNDNAFVVHALLELYRQKGDRAYLESAAFVMDRLMDYFWRNNLFTTVKEGQYARLSHLNTLALLDLVAAIRGQRLKPDSITKTELTTRLKIVNVGTWGGSSQSNDNAIVGRLTATFVPNPNLPDIIGGTTLPPRDNIAPIANDDQTILQNSGTLNLPYDTALLALSPVSYWRLGETSGSSALDQTGASNGIYSNGVTQNQSGALVGDNNTAVIFDGSNDYIYIPHDSRFALNDGSLSFWFKTDNIAQSSHLISKDAFGFGTGGHFGIGLSSGILSARIQSNTDSVWLTSTATLRGGMWHNVVLNFGASGLRLYLNGQLQASDTYTGGIAANTEPMAFGVQTGFSDAGAITPLRDFFQGQMDEIALFNTALTSAQIQTLYDAGNRASEGTTIDVLSNDTDADDDPLTITGISQGNQGNVSNNGTSLVYFPSIGFTGSDSFSYTISDNYGGSDTATVTIQANQSNSTPVIEAIDNITLSVGDRIDIAIRGSDADGDSLSFTLLNPPTFANLSNSNNGQASLALSPTAAGTYNLNVRVSDGALSSDTGFTLFVNAINNNDANPPVLSNINNLSLITGASTTLTVQATDADNDAITLSSTGLPNGSGFEDQGNGQGRFSFNTVVKGNYLITVTAQSRQRLDSQTFSLNVEDATALITLVNDSATTMANNALVIDVLTNDSGSNLFVSAITQGSYGTVVNNGTNVTYTANSTFSGTDTFTYTAENTNGDSATASVSITVNSPPTTEPSIAAVETIIQHTHQYQRVALQGALPLKTSVWEIGTTAEFTQRLLRKHIQNRDGLIIPLGLLQAENSYWVRVQFVDRSGNLSAWSTPFQFTTPMAANDSDNDGTDDRYQVDSAVDIYNNGVLVPRDRLCLLYDAQSNNVIGLKSNTGEMNCHSAYNKRHLIEVTDRILPYGLFNFKISQLDIDANNPTEIEISIYFSSDLEADMQWLSFDESQNALSNASNKTQFNGNRITLRLVDGGENDADGEVNGVILNTSGPSPKINTQSIISLPNENSGSGALGWGLLVSLLLFKLYYLHFLTLRRKTN